MKNICVVGSGYVGLVTGTCFADMGNRVITVDIDERKIEKLKQGILPIYEPGLEELVERNVQAGRLSFTTSYDEGLKDAEYVFICVGTPSAVDGEADLKYVRAAAQTVAEKMHQPLVIINKSTVPVGTGDWTNEIVRKSQPEPIDFAVVSCPEFLREGAAISDFMTPDRTVLGSSDRKAAEKVAELYEPLDAPIMITDIRTAEMIKYASNAFLATRISFINEISIICERLGADVTEVANGMGFDKRIGPHFLKAGVGYGGSCFGADETVFALNSPNVVAERIEDLFTNADGEPLSGDVVEVKLPQGKRVLSFDLETGKPVLADVQAMTRRPYQGFMVTIKASMGRELRVTADHPVILNDGMTFKTVSALDVTPGDQIMTLMRLPEVDAPQPYNLIDLLAGSDLEADADEMAAYIDVDADLMRLAGYYVAAGVIDDEGQVSFKFGIDERTTIEDLQRILTRYGLKFIERNATSATTTVVSSWVFAWFIRDVLRCGTKSDDKALPHIAFNVPDDLRFEVLRGAFSGDGSPTSVQDGKNLMLEYATVSQRLADGMTLLLQSLGVVPSIRRRMMNKALQMAYILRISGYRQLSILRDLFGDTQREKIDAILGGYQRVIEQRGFEARGDYTSLTVTDVQYEVVDTTVYSMETSTGVLITSSGSISHNCFPKDVKALANMAVTHGMHPQLLNAVMEINDFQRKHIIVKVRDLLDGHLQDKVIGILGLAFKENTDDVRESPSLTIARSLINQGAVVRAYDPVASENAVAELPHFSVCGNAYEVAEGADALLVLTPWNEFKQLDMQRILNGLRRPILIDGRNMYDPDDMREMGFTYRGVGRGYNGEGITAE